MSQSQITRRAFATDEWHAAMDALFQATGVSVSVMDFDKCELISGHHRCGYCHLAAEVSEMGPLVCFDVCPDSDAGLGRIVCRAGLACLYAPVVLHDSTAAHLVISGFVTSTRERRGLYEHMLARGMAEASARRAVKSLPVIARRQAESYLQMALASARTVLDATSERLTSAERIEELRLFVSAGQQVVSTERLDSDALSGITEEALALVGGEAGAILRPRGNLLEVVARTRGWRGSLGATVPRASTASGRALETRRTVVAPGKSGSSTLAMPLIMGDRVLAVMEIRIRTNTLPLPADRVSRLSRFGQFIAIAVEREDERAAVERAMVGYAQLNELAAALGGQSDVFGVARLLVSVLEKSFSSSVAGLVLTGWGNDRADVVINGDVAKTAPRTLVLEAAGRDIDADPFETMRYVTHAGSLVDAEEPEEWALATASLRYGDLDVGTLFVACADGERFCAQDHALLEGIAAHGGAAFARSALFSRIRDDYAKTIAALSATLDVGERATSGHATRVMDYAMFIGHEMGLDLESIEQLRFAGLLHDVGKQGISEEILLKPSRLTDEELTQIRRHPEIGASIVDQIDFLKGITPIILHHHERWDGKGYPNGLRGESIPLLARILCVADCFDAMTTERAYAKKLSIVQARLELEKGTGTQFDPRVVAAFFEVLDGMALSGGTGLVVSADLKKWLELPM